MISGFLKRCWLVLAFLIITAALISSLFRALTPWAKQYKTEVEQRLSQIFGEKVTINTMETDWYWFVPVIKLNQVNLFDGKQEAIKLNKLLIGINIFSSLWHWQFQPGVLLIEDLHLRLRQANEGWQIDGLNGLNSHRLTLDPASWQPLLAWILGQQKIIIKNFSAQIAMQDGRVIPLTGFNLHVANRANHYRIKGRGSLDQTLATHFQLLADLTLDPHALEKTKGRVFFSVQHLLPQQWQGFLPQARWQVQEGETDLQLWVDLLKGRLQSAQARLRFHDLAWFDKQTEKNQRIKTFKANLAWRLTKEGWQLAADQIHLGLGDTVWPENSFLLRYEKANQAYLIVVKKILLESLLSISTAWPEALKPILAAKPHGRLHHTQVQVKSSGIDFILTRFSHLGWQAGKSLALDNLAGAFYWRPKEGRLQLAGKKAVIRLKKQKPIRLSALDAAFAWQAEQAGLRLQVEHFIINHPNLLVSAKGVVDQISSHSPGQLALTATFAAKNAEHWLPYLPANHLKPKLEAWLKQDVKRIKRLSANLLIQGPAAGFPFDKEAGEFTMDGYIEGLDLVFARHWPLVKDIEGYLRINKRNLEVDIRHADLEGIMIDKANLSVAELGLDREVLLLRAKTHTKAAKALRIIRSSPLNKKLSALAILKMRGLLSLDLQLEAPLYPENNKILALGHIDFQNNEVTVHHSMKDIELSKLRGSLQFNEQGISDSDLRAKIFNCPANLRITSIHEPLPYTQVKIVGQASAEALGKKLNLPIFALLRGSLWLKSTLKLTDDPDDLDHLQVQTSLDGLGIDLPPPLGKAAEAKTPLTVDIDFNPQKALRLRFNYANRLSSDLWFSNQKNRFALQKGEIRLGSGEAQEQDQKGLQLVGSLPYFNLEQWLAVKSRLAKREKNSLFLETLDRIDIKFAKAKIWQETYDDLVFKATKLAEDDWSIQLNQALLAAKLHYQPTSNTLVGQFDKLGLKKPIHNRAMISTLKPMDLPNLDLHIRSLQLGALDLGDVTLKTQSSDELWRLHYCKIITPSYSVMAKGEWRQEGKLNSTTLQASMQVSDLAKSLERWKISPAVEAQRGNLQFQGGWEGALADFQLAKLKGEVKMDFKEGRITHLSPETEGKLGLGKLLSILSLQTIPRRLKLDFSDLAKAGYSFDKFQGSFELSNGIMKTEDSYIDGPVAYASMKGNLDIAKQHYNVDLKISPHITASLPLVATIAGGPIAGVATWVASKIINQGMQNISSYSYKVTGPWQEPLVQQVSIVKKGRIPLRG